MLITSSGVPVLALLPYILELLDNYFPQVTMCENLAALYLVFFRACIIAYCICLLLCTVSFVNEIYIYTVYIYIYISMKYFMTTFRAGRYNIWPISTFSA